MFRPRFCCELRIHDAHLFEKKQSLTDYFGDAIIIRTFISEFSTCLKWISRVNIPCWIVTYEDFSVEKLREDLKKLEETDWYLLTLSQDDLLSGSFDSLKLERSYYKIQDKICLQRLSPAPIPESPLEIPENSIQVKFYSKEDLGSYLSSLSVNFATNHLFSAFKLFCVHDHPLATMFARESKTLDPADTLPYLNRYRPSRSQSSFNAKELAPRIDKNWQEKLVVELEALLKLGQSKQVMQRIGALKAKQTVLNFDLELLFLESLFAETSSAKLTNADEENYLKALHLLAADLMLKSPEAPEAQNWSRVSEIWRKTFPPISKEIKLELIQPTAGGDTALAIVCHGIWNQTTQMLSSFWTACSDRNRIGSIYVLSVNQSNLDQHREICSNSGAFYCSTLEEALESYREFIIDRRFKYAIVLDDNYRFVNSCNFIGSAEKLFNSEPDLGEVVFNRNYAISLDEIQTEVAEVCQVGQELFFRHAMYKGKNASWPHFSLQPAIHKLTAWKEVGPFAETNLEVNYAWRYWKDGFRTGFLPLIYCIKVEPPQLPVTEFSPRISIQVINLQRRADRWEKISTKLKNAIQDDSIQIHRFDAVDGQAITLSAEETKIFEGNSFNWRAGIVGCALSHYQLWQKLINDSSSDAYVILEDDVELSVNFNTKLQTLFKDYSAQHLVYLGASIYRDKRTSERWNPEAAHSQLRVWDYKDRATLDTYCNGGAFAYLISKEAARLCCAEVERRGIKVPIDCFLFDLFSKLEVWEMAPYLIYTEYVDARVDTQIDSDIQMVTTQVKR